MFSRLSDLEFQNSWQYTLLRGSKIYYCFLFLPRLQLFGYIYSKSSNTVKCYYNLKQIIPILMYLKI